MNINKGKNIMKKSFNLSSFDADRIFDITV